MKRSLRDVTKRFDAHTVLDRVSLKFDGAHCLALIGPSGGGKSTLLRCVNGLERFESGEVRVQDLAFGPRGSPADRRALAAIRLRVGFVFQDWNLFAHRTALGNVMEAPVHVKKVPLDEAKERGMALLEKVGLAHRVLAYPHEMSGGEQQRVAIARALAMDPDALLLDEPTSALDPEMTAEVLELIEELKREGRDLLLVTHEMGFARQIADRVALLAEGRIAEFGPPQQIFDAPESPITKAFLSRVLKY